MKINRHNLVEISDQGRKEIYEHMKPFYQGNPKSLEQIKKLIVDGYGMTKVPGIVRREEHDDLREYVAVGFSSPDLYNGSRLRIPAATSKKEVVKVITPYDTIHYSCLARNRSMQTLEEIKKEAFGRGIKLGIWGSVGLELYTKLPYTHDASDLDLLLDNTDYETISNFNSWIKKIGKKNKCNIDVELDLPNGYGIKLDELFMKTEAILGKSLYGVTLIPRRTVLEMLNR